MPEGEFYFEIGNEVAKWDENAPNAQDTRTFDIYGLKLNDIHAAKSEIEAAIGQELTWHESGYRMLEYYGCITPLEEEIRLTRNTSQHSQPLESQVPATDLVLYLWRTQRAPELEQKLLDSNLQATLIRRDELEYYCSDGSLREYADLTIANLVKYGKIEAAEARKRVDESGWFSREVNSTFYGCLYTFHEIPYHHAMDLLHAKTNPNWSNDTELNAWPPPWGANLGTGLTKEEEVLALKGIRQGWYA